MPTPEASLSLSPSVAPAPATPRARASTIAAHVATALVVLFLAFDLSIKVLALEPAVRATVELGYPAEVSFWLGLVELVCLVLYLVPRTAPLGALLFTGYLGGAVATHVRLANPLFSHVLFPLYVAVLLWLPLYLRDARLRALAFGGR